VCRQPTGAIDAWAEVVCEGVCSSARSVVEARIEGRGIVDVKSEPAISY
jgi:hypothetical protein